MRQKEKYKQLTARANPTGISTGGRFGCFKPAPNLSHVTSSQWAYIAGFLDGEGCISANVAGLVEIRVSQIDPRPIFWLQKLLGGNVVHRDATNARLQQWSWRSDKSLAAEAVLKGCIPYLIVKRQQALAAFRIIHSGDQIERQKWKRNLQRLKKRDWDHTKLSQNQPWAKHG